jgi:hypothetical protein
VKTKEYNQFREEMSTVYNERFKLFNFYKIGVRSIQYGFLVAQVLTNFVPSDANVVYPYYFNFFPHIFSQVIKLFSVDDDSLLHTTGVRKALDNGGQIKLKALVGICDTNIVDNTLINVEGDDGKLVHEIADFKYQLLSNFVFSSI